MKLRLKDIKVGDYLKAVRKRDFVSWSITYFRVNKIDKNKISTRLISKKFFDFNKDGSFIDLIDDTNEMWEYFKNSNFTKLTKEEFELITGKALLVKSLKEDED